MPLRRCERTYYTTLLYSRKTFRSGRTRWSCCIWESAKTRYRRFIMSTYPHSLNVRGSDVSRAYLRSDTFWKVTFHERKRERERERERERVSPLVISLWKQHAGFLINFLERRTTFSPESLVTNPITRPSANPIFSRRNEESNNAVFIYSFLSLISIKR